MQTLTHGALGLETPQDGGLTLRLFGSFEANLNGTPMRGFELREADRLFAFLIFRAYRLVSTVRIADTLWPDTGSLDSLYQSVRQLRSVLGGESIRLESQKGYLRLNLDGADVDLFAFNKSITQGTLESLKSAIAIYTSPLLETWEDGWVNVEREKRRAQYLGAIKTVAADYRCQEDYAQVAALLRLYMKTRRTEEWLWRDLMIALAKSGERYEALRLYEKSRESVFKKIEPPEDMTRLAREIQRSHAGGRQSAISSPPVIQATVPMSGKQSDDIYVLRPADHRLNEAISRLDSIVLLHGPAQTGKTLMLAKGLEFARNSGANVVQSDLRKFSQEEMANAESFYMALAYSIAEQLEIVAPPPESWNPKRSANASFEGYIRNSVLKHLTTPLVWGLDEVDRLFEMRYGTDVFALFRAWHNARSLDPGGPWKSLTMIFAYSTEAQWLIPDLNQSPFNVGVRIAVADLSPAQVAELNQWVDCPLKTDHDMKRFLALVGGHPYLAHHGLLEIAAQSLDMDEFERCVDREDGIYGSHLRHIRSLLIGNEANSSAVRDLIAGKPGLKEDTFYRLRAVGLVSGETERDAQMRCPLYSRYLERRLA